VILITPDTYYIFTEYNEDGSVRGGWSDTKRLKNMEGVRSYINDMFRAGDTLQVMRLSIPGDGLKQLPDGTYDYTAGARREDAVITIGAIINSESWRVLDFLWSNNGSLFTTHAGLAAMGIEAFGYKKAAVKLTEVPDEETHAYLTGALEAIAMRGESIDLRNNAQNDRDSKTQRTMLQISMLAFILLLLSMCVSLVNNAITNRLRSDKRAIGTLRAVGARLSDIIRSYQLQALAMLIWGILAGNALNAGIYLWLYFSLYPYGNSLVLPYGSMALVQAAFLLLIALFCGVNLAVRIREITRDSIVANIREL